MAKKKAAKKKVVEPHAAVNAYPAKPSKPKKKNKKSVNRANLIALISSLFMIVIPIFLSRTIAGIPEKESAAFFFMFLSLLHKKLIL